MLVFNIESHAARLERSSFCRNEVQAKKRERKADKAAQIKPFIKPEQNKNCRSKNLRQFM